MLINTGKTGNIDRNKREAWHDHYLLDHRFAATRHRFSFLLQLCQLYLVQAVEHVPIVARISMASNWNERPKSFWWFILSSLKLLASATKMRNSYLPDHHWFWQYRLTFPRKNVRRQRIKLMVFFLRRPHQRNKRRIFFWSSTTLSISNDFEEHRQKEKEGHRHAVLIHWKYSFS